jgi:hypothetical protein
MKDLKRALKAVDELIRDSGTWLHEEDSQEQRLLYRNVNVATLKY